MKQLKKIQVNSGHKSLTVSRVDIEYLWPYASIELRSSFFFIHIFPHPGFSPKGRITYNQIDSDCYFLFGVVWRCFAESLCICALDSS